MKVKIRLKETSQELVFENVANAYTKGGLYCLYLRDRNTVIKFPLANVWSVEEEYTPGGTS